MNREALVQLRRVVEAAPDKGWNMGYFAVNRDCSTVHCAAGWASVDPWFQDNCPILPPWRAVRGWDGISAIFGLCPSQGDVLFGLNASYGPSDVSKEAVIANIDRLLAGEPPIPYDDGEDDDDA